MNMKWDKKEQRWIESFKALHNQQVKAFDNLISGSQYWLAYETFLKIYPQVNPKIRVLDWGCGTGHFSYFLLKSGFTTDSFNLNNKKLHDMGEIQIFDLLKSKFKDSFSYRTGTDPVKLPYPDNSFDAITSIGVLEHVRESGGNEMQSLKEINRVLKKGGVFFCYHFPNKFSWIDAIAKIIPYKLWHRYKFTKKNIETLNEAAGLTIQEIKKYAFFPRNTAKKFLRGMANKPAVVKLYNMLDGCLGSIPLCTNYLFWSKK